MPQLTLTHQPAFIPFTEKICCTCKKTQPEVTFYIGRSNMCCSCYKDYYQNKKQQDPFTQINMKQVVLVVSKDNQLIDCGEPETFILWKIRDYLEQGHIIRQVSEEDFNKSGLKDMK